MNIYLQMLSEGMQKRGHQTDVWKPEPLFYKLPLPSSIKKWMGYIDQFIIFPNKVKKRLNKNNDAMYVFTDNALGPWVPLVSDRPHIVHCHDFLAQESELGNISENRLSWTGRQYQNFIRKGYKKAKHFVCVSQKTKNDLLRILGQKPLSADVVYNGINPIFKPMDAAVIRKELSGLYNIALHNGYLLHVGGNLWYKNRKGVIECYLEWRSMKTENNKPLMLVGENLNEEMNALISGSPFKKDIHVLQGIDDATIVKLYAGASVFLFPSLYEGFGWPIAEAMACAVPVITTETAPMTEVGGTAAFYVPKRPSDAAAIKVWAAAGAVQIDKILEMSPLELRNHTEEGIRQVKKFDLELNLDKMETLYKEIYATSKV